jgi:uncharacterized protein YaiI (UPF0178 family)
MNVKIIYKTNVTDGVLDDLAKEMPVIVSEVMEVAGGKLAILKRDQVALEFSLANKRDTGADIRIMVFARNIDSRTSSESHQANTILEKVVSVLSNSGDIYSVNIRLYFMEIRAAEHFASI